MEARSGLVSRPRSSPLSSPLSSSAFPLRRRLRRAVLARRRLLAAVMAAVAVLVGLQSVSRAPAPRRFVVTAARDLPGGAAITRNDLAVTALPPDAVPSGAVSGRGALSGVRRRALCAPGSPSPTCAS